MANAYTVNKDMRERTTIEMIIKSHDKLKEKVEKHLIKQNKKIQAQQLETALNNLFTDVKKFQNNPDTFEDKIAGQFYSEWLSEVNNTLTSSGNANITKLLGNFNLTNLSMALIRATSRILITESFKPLFLRPIEYVTISPYSTAVSLTPVPFLLI